MNDSSGLDAYNDRMRALLVLVRTSQYNRLPEEHHTSMSSVLQPQCGDRIALHATISNGIVEDIVFQAHGCLLSSAAAALVAAYAHNQHIDRLRAVTDDELVALVNLPVGANRRLCVTMAADALRSLVAAVVTVSP